jgi:phosphoglucomutase
MAIHPLAGKPVPPSMLADIARLVTSYYTKGPEPANREQKVAFGTSGHRGSSLRGSFNEAHILAITQAICDFRLSRGIAGPLFLGMDTHALSEPSHATAVEVLAANGVDVFLQEGPGYTPTPVISHAILTHNRRSYSRADGIVITPSHNQPEDGGFKYNPPEGGPPPRRRRGGSRARANGFLEAGKRRSEADPVRKGPPGGQRPSTRLRRALREGSRKRSRHGSRPVSGSGWPPIPWEDPPFRSGSPSQGSYGLDVTVVNDAVDPTFRFMTVDHGREIGWTAPPTWAMARLIDLAGKYDIAFGIDPAATGTASLCRHGGLMNPNHYLAVAVLVPVPAPSPLG